MVDGCVDLGDQIWGIAWAPGGQLVGVETWDGSSSDVKAWLLTADGRQAAEVLTVRGLVLDSLVVGPDGRRAWLAGEASTALNTLVEDRIIGRRQTTLPNATSALGWTIAGYAFVQRRQVGDGVLVINPDQPDKISELHSGGGSIDRFWISPDAKVMVFTRHGNGGGAEFQVVDPGGIHTFEPTQADGSGASVIGADVVYHAATGEMLAVPIKNPGAPFVLLSRPTLGGMISDQGVLATAERKPMALLCLTDVSAALR